MLVWRPSEGVLSEHEVEEREEDDVDKSVDTEDPHRPAAVESAGDLADLTNVRLPGM